MSSTCTAGEMQIGCCDWRTRSRPCKDDVGRGEQHLRRGRGEWCAVCAVYALCVQLPRDLRSFSFLRKRRQFGQGRIPQLVGSGTDGLPLLPLSSLARKDEATGVCMGWIWDGLFGR